METREVSVKRHHMENIVGMGALGSALRQQYSKDEPIVFFCVKAFDLQAAIEAADKSYDQDVIFVTLSNGYLGNIWSTLKVQERRVIRQGVTTIGARFDNSGALVVTNAEGGIKWGSRACGVSIAITAQEEEVLKRHSMWEWRTDIEYFVRDKWIANCVINSLCAVHQLMRNGHVLKFWKEAEILTAEACLLSQRLWPDLNAVEVSLTIERIRGLVAATFDNENSMARDVRLKRQTETDFLGGMAMGFDGFNHLKSVHETIKTLSEGAINE